MNLLHFKNVEFQFRAGSDHPRSHPPSCFWHLFYILLLGEAHWLRPPTLARHHGKSSFAWAVLWQVVLGKEHGTHKPPPTGRVQERSKGDTTCPTTSQNPLWHPPRLNKVCIIRKDSESGWLVKDNLKTNPITIKPETASHMAEQFSWVPLPSCSPLGCPFPIKLLLCQHMCLLGQFISEC